MTVYIVIMLRIIVMMILLKYHPVKSYLNDDEASSYVNVDKVCFEGCNNFCKRAQTQVCVWCFEEQLFLIGDLQYFQKCVGWYQLLIWNWKCITEMRSIHLKWYKVAGKEQNKGFHVCPGLVSNFLPYSAFC